MDILDKYSPTKTIFLFLFLVINVVTNAAVIKGKITDAETHKPIAGAAVSIVGSNTISIADSHGDYIFNNLKPGTYSIIGTCMGYTHSVSKTIKINLPDELVSYDLALIPSVILEKEVVISATQNKETNVSARTDEKLAPNVVNIISAKAIESLPDLNAADVLQRVPGISMMKNSSGSNTYAIIRGMPPRFSSTLINGVTMPNPGSSGRSVSLDIIGSEFIGRIEVIKALTPDLESDGIGGTVNVVMKQAPDASFLNFQLSTGYNQYYFNHGFLTFNSKNIMTQDFYQTKGSSYIPSLSDFPRTNLVINSKPAFPNINGNLSFGRRFLKNKLGFMVAASSQDSHLASTYNTVGYNIDAFNKMQIGDWEGQTYCKDQQRYGGYVKVDYRFNENNQIIFYNSFFQMNEMRARVVSDTLAEDTRTGPGTGTVHSYNQTITDNSGIESAILKGNHKLLKNLDIDWSLVYAKANSNSPDYSSVFLVQTIPAKGAKTPKYLNYSSCITRLWQWETDEDKSAFLNLNYKPLIFNHLFEFKAGGMGRIKFRKNYANEYDFNATPDNYLYPNPDIMTVPISTKNDQQKQGNAVNNPGNYRAWEDVQAAYGMVTTEFGKLQVLTGVRMEFTYMANEHNQADPQVPVAHARFYYFDYLPSLHLKYKIMEKQNLRFSVYQAINRPNYTEVIPYSDIRPGGMTGNPNLRHSTGTCYDLRYEIYPQHEELFAAGVFYKNITNAIEELVKPGSESRSVQNVPNCTNWGVELVGMKYLGDFGIDMNYTYTHSEVVVPKHFNVIDASNNVSTIIKMENRPLVGQSPHVINTGISYRNNRYGLKCSVVYTMQGRHIINVSDSYGKDEYQSNYHNLGATFEKLFSKKFSILIKAANLLNYPIKCYTKEGDFVEKLNNYQSYFIGLKLTI